MNIYFLIGIICISPYFLKAQITWKNVDSIYGINTNSVHVFYSNDSLEGKPNKAYYVEADLKDKNLIFSVDTTMGRRFTPMQFFKRNNFPLLIVNCTFFEFTHNSNINVVMKNKKLLAYNNQTIAGRGKDTFTYKHILSSAFGITAKRNADIAFTFTDSAYPKIYASQNPMLPVKDSLKSANFALYKKNAFIKKWKMQTAIGGGPVLIQNGEIKITNNEEIKFAGKAINDKHPRTAIGYTKQGKIILLVVEGRFSGKAEGATLLQEAKMLRDIGCWEAMNLDGGGSSCLLMNGKETITPSDKEGERPVPAVFIISQKK